MDTKLAQMIDHTLLKADATESAIRKLCEEAKTNGFYSVCVNSRWVGLAAKLLAGTSSRAITVVGFPLGAMGTAAKAFEAEWAVKQGAAEIDMVLDVGGAKSGQWKEVEDDIRAVVKASGSQPVKVILETCYLTNDEIKKACEISVSAGAAFVKTSTGFGTGGATVEQIKLMRATVGPKVGVKASGGIRDRATALAMIEAGASRLGCSASIAIASTSGASAGAGAY